MDTKPQTRHVPGTKSFGAHAPDVEEAMNTLVGRFALKVPSRRHAGRRGLAPFLFTLLLGLALLSGCGGGGGGTLQSSSGSSSATGTSGTGGSGSNSGSGGSNAGTAVLVSLGDFATVPDQIVSFEITIESVALRSSSGDVSLLSTPRRLELGRLKGEPLVLANVPQGRYSGVVIGVSNPEISFIDSEGALHEHVAATLTSSTATNPSEFGFGSTPGAVNLNLFLRASLGSGSAVTVTPALNFSTGGEPTKDLVGRITSVGSSSFTIDIGNRAFPFATDSSTEFQGITTLNQVTAGMTVEVDGVLGSGGTFRATKFELENADPSARLAQGLTLSTSLAQLQMLVREVHGPAGVTLPEVGRALTVNANSSTQFRLEPDGVDLTHLDFTPTFDALTIARGQNLEAATATDSATTITADSIKLKKQSLDGIAGTVTAGGASGQFSFPLKLSADSALAQLTGHDSIVVTLQPSTQTFLYFGFEDCVTCIAGGNVRVRGLLFFSGGQYRLVAEWLAVTS